MRQAPRRRFAGIAPGRVSYPPEPQQIRREETRARQPRILQWSSVWSPIWFRAPRRRAVLTRGCRALPIGAAHYPRFAMGGEWSGLVGGRLGQATARSRGNERLHEQRA